MGDKKKQESMERLQQQLEQAKLDGNTSLIKMIKSIMEKINGKKDQLAHYSSKRLK